LIPSLFCFLSTKLLKLFCFGIKPLDLSSGFQPELPQSSVVCISWTGIWHLLEVDLWRQEWELVGMKLKVLPSFRPSTEEGPALWEDATGQTAWQRLRPLSPCLLIWN
jgi:hypothetical protein